MTAVLVRPAGAESKTYQSPWGEEQASFNFSRPVPGDPADAFVAAVRIKLSALPQVRGATFAVRSADPDNQAGLDFESFSKLVAEQLEKNGLTPSTTPDYVVWVNCVTYDGQVADPKLHKDVFTVVIIRSGLTEGDPGRIVYKAAAVSVVPDMEGELAHVMPPMIRALFQRFPQSPGERIVKCGWN